MEDSGTFLRHGPDICSTVSESLAELEVGEGGREVESGAAAAGGGVELRVGSGTEEESYHLAGRAGVRDQGEKREGYLRRLGRV